MKFHTHTHIYIYIYTKCLILIDTNDDFKLIDKLATSSKILSVKICCEF